MAGIPKGSSRPKKTEARASGEVYMGNDVGSKRTRWPVTERTDFSLPSSDCDCPPWEACEHLPTAPCTAEVSLEQWNFLKSIE